MDFNQLPPELMRHLFRYLGNNDLLRLRRATLRYVLEDGNGGDAGEAALEVNGGDAGEAAVEVNGGDAGEAAAEVNEGDAAQFVEDDAAEGQDEAGNEAQDNSEDEAEVVRQPLEISVNDFLRNRSVNTKTYYIGHDAELVRLERNEAPWNRIHYMDMEDFLRLRLPMRAMRFNFSFRPEDHIFSDEEWDMRTFTYRHEQILTHLTLSELTLPLRGHVANTFFTNVSQSIRFLSIGTLRFREIKHELAGAMPPFWNLTTLKIDYLDLDEENEFNQLMYFWRVVGFCYHLETFHLPRNVALNELERLQRYRNLGYQHLGMLRIRHNLPNLQSYDLSNLWWIDANFAGPNTFVHFCNNIQLRGVRLQNVDIRCFQTVNEPQDLETIGDVIYSMKEFILTFGEMQFPHLEKIYIETSSSKAGDVNPKAEFHVPEWPSLNYLELTVNSDALDDDVPTAQLFEVLFYRAFRPTVETLYICGYDDHDIQFPLPNLVNIARCCPNLTSITIENWTARDEEYAEMWGTLRNLQSITLRDCRNIGLGAFTGANVLEPVFLNLNNLTILRLIRVQRMTHITDDVFRLIFRHLQLEEFILDSYEEDFLTNIEDVISFSREGIESLMNSDFSRTIQRFPFKCFRLAGFTRNQMSDLGENFRSAQMI